jgi:3-oxoacyl-[acyl-carrier protein] reductase
MQRQLPQKSLKSHSIPHKTRPTSRNSRSKRSKQINTRRFHAGANLNTDLLGKTAIITGGSRGIGLSAAKLLLSRGANVVYCSRTKESIINAEENLLKTFPQFSTVTPIISISPSPTQIDDLEYNKFHHTSLFSTPHSTTLISSQFFHGITCDVASDNSIQQFFSQLKNLKSQLQITKPRTTEGGELSQQSQPIFNGADILINCAGICQNQLLLRTTEPMITNVLDVNVTGTILMTKHFLKQLPVFPTTTTTTTTTATEPSLYESSINNSNYYRVINLSSVVGKQGNPGQAVYATSKAAVDGFTRSMSKEMSQYRGSPITFNSISPGFIETDMTSDMTPEQLGKILDRVGLKRIGQPEEIANVIGFLSSKGSSYINGQTICADGGM